MRNILREDVLDYLRHRQKHRDPSIMAGFPLPDDVVYYEILEFVGNYYVSPNQRFRIDEARNTVRREIIRRLL